MAAGAFTLYSAAALGLSKASFNLSVDVLVMVLLTGSYTPAPDTDALWSDVSANELPTANGYTAGGVVLSSVADTLIGATVKFTSAAVSWASFSATCRYAAIVRRSGAALADGDLLLAYCDLTGGSGDLTGGGGALTITPNASGIFATTHNP